MSWQTRMMAKADINHYSRKDTNHHIKGSDSAANRRTLVVVPFSAAIDDRLGAGRLDIFTTTADTELDLNTAANWDAVTPTDYTVAATRAGKDFYIYACVQAGAAPKILLSANSTYPSGYTANNSRKIGGFHVLSGNCANMPSGHPYDGFEQGAIVYHSIWDLLDRPRCAPEGMAKISATPSDGKPSLWTDIYLATGDGTTPSSVFGATIKSSIDWITFVEYGNLLGKRLLRDAEFSLAALGSNELTNIAGGTDPVTVTFAADAAGRSMMSNFGIVGMCGIRSQWLNEQAYAYMPDGSAAASYNTRAVTHAASPGGNPIYAKFLSDGTPYLCCNMATDAENKWLTFGTNYKILITHDADAATGSTQVYFDYDVTQPARLLANLGRGKTCFISSNNPDYFLQITHDASAATNGVALYYDDGSDERLEATIPSSANADLDLAVDRPINQYVNLHSKGQNYGQGQSTDIKLSAGGSYSSGNTAGSQARWALYNRGTVLETIGARFCCDPW